MSADDRAERRRRRQAESDAMPLWAWLSGRVVPYVGVVGFFLGMSVITGEADLVRPAFIIGTFWGIGILMSVIRREQRRLTARSAAALAAELPTAAAPPVASPDPAAPVLPVPQPTATSRPPPGVPRSVADIAAGVVKVGVGLRAHGRARVAETLDRGLAEVVRLAALIDAATHPEALADLRTEIDRLRAQADASADPETAALWAANVATAERRLEKLQALDAAASRTRARIEAFRQAVKSLAVDLARLDLAGEEGATLPLVDEHAAGLERDVEALVRTRTELDRLERGPTAAVARPSPVPGQADDDDAGRRQRQGQRSL